MSETKEKKIEFEALAQNDLGTEWGVYRGTEEWNSYRGREARAYALTEVRNLNRLLHESAAAPDLLAAAKGVIEYEGHAGKDRTTISEWDALIAAIALATESRP